MTLPSNLEAGNDFKYVIKGWITRLTFKQQTVLLAAIRGCDGVQREDISKKIVRRYRSVILEDADGTIDATKERYESMSPNDPRYVPPHFMNTYVSDLDIKIFLKSMDHYPMHWLFHFLHAVEILGYKHPQVKEREWWHDLYRKMVEALHLNIETEEEMDERLKDGEFRSCWKS
jgi:hypothetical protein